MRMMVSIASVPRSMTRRQRAGAPFEVEAQRQLVQVPEGAVGELAHRVLADRGEQHVAQLRQHHHQDAADAIGDDEEQRRHGEREWLSVAGRWFSVSQSTAHL